MSGVAAKYCYPGQIRLSAKRPVPAGRIISTTADNFVATRLEQAARFASAVREAKRSSFKFGKTRVSWPPVKISVGTSRNFCQRPREILDQVVRILDAGRKADRTR